MTGEGAESGADAQGAPSGDTYPRIFFELRAGAPPPVARLDPSDGWGALAGTAEEDGDGYVVATVEPGDVVIPDGTHGRLTLRLSTPGAYSVTLGSGEYHLVFALECDGCEVRLAFGASGPSLAGAAFGPAGVSPLFNNPTACGLTHLEFSGLGTRSFEMRHVLLKPGLALLARAASLWVTRTRLTVEELPDVGEGFYEDPAPMLLTGNAELVLALGTVVIPKVQRIPKVRVVASGFPMAGLTADIDHLHVAAGCRYSIPDSAVVRHCTLHQCSRLKISPYTHVAETVAAKDSLNPHLSLDDYPPVIEVPSRVDRRVSSVGILLGPVEVRLDCTRPHKAERWRPGELWIKQRAERVHFDVQGLHYITSRPPTVRFMSSAYGRSNSFGVSTDDRVDYKVPMRIGLHMAERSGLYEAKGEVLLRQAQRATIDGTHVEGLMICGLVAPEVTPFDEAEDEATHVQAVADEQPAFFRGARVTDIKLDLASEEAPQLLQELRLAEVFDAHPAVWSASGQPLGLPALDRTETPFRDEFWITPWAARRPTSHSSRQHDMSLELLGEVTKERGRSGTVKSGVARATLVRRQQRTRFWPENVLLLAGRPLGFGYLILRAGLAWIAISTAVAGVTLGSNGFDPSAAGVARLVEGALNVAVEPLAMVRGVKAGSWLESQVSVDRQYLVTLGRVIVAVPLVAMFVAIARRSRSGASGPR